MLQTLHLFKESEKIDMDSTEITDSQGKHLRAKFFPFHLRKRVPSTLSGLMKTKMLSPLDHDAQGRRASTAPHFVGKKFPTTYMIVDYRHDRKQLLSQAALEEKNQLTAPAVAPYIPPPMPVVLSPIRNETKGLSDTDSPDASPSRRKTRHGAGPLRSSFVLKKKRHHTDDKIDISALLYNKNDAGTQTEVKLERQNFATLSDYQNWSNDVAEPFFRELRKAVKANRPKDLEEYCIEYCRRHQQGLPPPILQETNTEVGSYTGK